MEQKNGQSVYEVMTKYAGEVIAEMAYGHEIEMYTVEQGEKRDKRQ